MSTPLRVLMIEDSEDDALLMFRTLNKGGYDPVYERVETAAAMKDALQNKSWDIILCDYKLPVFSGLKAIALLKELNIDIPFIIVSGTIGEETAVECMRLGAHDYVMKNNLSRLVPAIARELAEVKSRIERRRAEQAVVTSELRLKELFEHMSNCVAVYEAREDGTDFIIKDFNRAAEIAEKVDREKIIGKSILQIFPGAREIGLFAALQRVWKTGRPEQLRASYYRDDRIQGWRENYVYKLQTGEVVALYNDITERKEAERKIFESEEKYRLLVENSGEAIYIAQDGMLKFVNPATVAMYGHSAEVLTSTPFTEFIHPDDREMVMSFHLKRVKGKVVPAVYSYRIITASGNFRWVELHTQLISWQDRSATLNFLTDITDRKQVEEKLQKSEEKYRSIIENAQEGIYQSTPEGRHITLNQAFANILGYESPDEVMATITDIASQLYVNPDDRKKLLQLMEEQDSVKGYEAEFYRKDGSHIWVSINMYAIRDKEGHLLYYQGIDQDITEKKMLDAERQQNVNRLRKSLESTIHAMAVTVETRDPYTAGHQRKVADLSRAIAVEMNIGRNQIDGLYLAGMIHDIGKISIPSEILTKPTKLTDLEFNLLKTHPLSGYNILKDIDFYWPIARIVLEHHERLDGSGYPNGLKGEQVLLESRILSIADVVEAISSHRPYRPAPGMDLALEEITRNSGVLYDPEVVNACLRLFKEKRFSFAV